MQYSKKRPLVLVALFSTDQSMFCDLQEYLQTLKFTGTYVIRTLMLIIMYIQMIVVCYTLVFFS